MDQSDRPLYPGNLSSAFASSVAKYLVFTNLFPGQLPQVSVYQPPRTGGQHNETQITKESNVINEEMGMTADNQHQTSSSQQNTQTLVNRNSQQNVSQTSAQVCYVASM